MVRSDSKGSRELSKFIQSVNEENGDVQSYEGKNYIESYANKEDMMINQS